MSRSLKKGPYIDERVFNKVKKAKEAGSSEIINVYSRACSIIPEFVGTKFGVHNGKKFIEVFVTEDMVGHKLGEFSLTTVFKSHGGKNAKK